MNNKNSLSAIEKLRLRKIELNHECKAIEVSLTEDLTYAKENVGMLALGYILSDRSKQNFSVCVQKMGNLKTLKKHALPLVWNITRSMLVNLAVKRTKLFLFGPKRKKRNQ